MIDQQARDVDDVDDHNGIIKLTRPIYDQGSFDELYGDAGDDVDSRKRSVFVRCRRHFSQCTVAGASRAVLRYLPVITHVREYNWRECLLSDVISGISAGVVHVPQAMGYALLAGLPPVYGLYASIFPGWLYYLFATSRHLSIGTSALTSLLVGGVVSKIPVTMMTTTYNQTASLQAASDVTTVTSASNGVGVKQVSDDIFSSSNSAITVGIISQSQPDLNDPVIAVKVGVALSVTLLAGLFQLLMRLLKLGVLATYMSGPFISAFMTAAALQIIVSQLPFQLGLTIQRPYGAFELPLTLVEVFSNITNTNLCALTASVLSSIFLIAIKEGVNEKFKTRMKVPVPAELILVIVATLIAHFAHMNSQFGLAIIGPIPTGLPVPSVPPMNSVTSYIFDGCVLGLIGFAIGITMAKLLAERHKYDIDINQELLASSIQNIVCPFFGCFMSAQSPPRTMVQETTGCRTQLAGFISTFLPLLVVLFIGPLFESLPISVLACVISCALIPLLKQFQQLKTLWLVSRYDFITWIVTFLCTTVISVTVGLVLGMVISVLVIMIQIQSVKGTVLQQAGNTEIYHQKDTILSQHLQRRVLVFRFDGPVIFVNAETFVDQLYKRTIDPLQAVRPERREAATAEKSASKAVENEVELSEKCVDDGDSVVRATNLTADVNVENGSSKLNVEDRMELKSLGAQSNVKAIVLDCSRISNIDMMGLGALKKVWNAYKSVGIELLFAECDKRLISKLQAVKLINEEKSCKNVGDDRKRNPLLEIVYPTVHDAVMSTQLK